MLLIYIIFTLPTNVLMILLIILGKIPLIPFIFMLSMLIPQMMCIFGFHLASVMYSNKIHYCGKRLLCLSFVKRRLAIGVVEWSNQIKAKIRVAFYIEKFHTSRKFGITYGSFGLISFSAFVKVSLG